MSETTYKDYIPGNARVLVEYTKPPHERVKFAYPENLTYEKAYQKFVLNTFKGIASIRFYFGLAIGLAICSLIYIFENLSTLIAPFKSQPQAQTYNPFLFRYTTTTQTTLYNPYFGFIIPIAIGLMFCIFMYIIPYTEYFYYKKRPKELADLVPKANYLTSRIWRGLRYIKATPEDIKNGMFFLPIFHNVYLDYSCTGDISKQLEKITVMEYEFDWQRIGRNGKLGKKHTNHYDWYTIFKFKEQPKDGELEIKYI